MKKMLMIGTMNAVFQKLYEDIEEACQIQICEPIYKNIERMMKIIKPQMVLIVLNGSEEINSNILSLLKGDWEDVPVLIFCGRKEDFVKSCPPPQFTILARPVKNEVVREKILEMLGESTQTAGVNASATNSKQKSEQDVDARLLGAAVQLGKEMRAAEAPVVEISANNSEHRSHKKILAIDDNPATLRNLKQILETKYEVYVTTSAEKGLELAESILPSLIILDYEMPGMSGNDMLKVLKQDLLLYSIPVIFLTGVSDMNRVREVVVNKPAGYFLKPIDVEALMKTIVQLIGK